MLRLADRQALASTRLDTRRPAVTSASLPKIQKIQAGEGQAKTGFARSTSTHHNNFWRLGHIPFECTFLITPTSRETLPRAGADASAPSSLTEAVEAVAVDV